MFAKYYNHYDCLNVTREAPAEVIRAAYRSLSQKHHPDKNIGDHDAAQIMMRLNAAYSVLSDSEQRRLYDLQLLDKQPVPQPRHVFLRHLAKGRNGRMVAILLGGIFIVLLPVSWIIWKDNQSALRIEQGMILATDRANTPAPGWPVASRQADEGPADGGAPIARTAPVGASGHVDPPDQRAATATLAAPATMAQVPAAPGAATKASEFARLTAMLRSMGLGLHKLELPAQAANARPAPTAEPTRTAEPATAYAAPAAPPAAASTVALSDKSRVREELVRPAAPDPARGDAKSVADNGRASPAPAASLSAPSASPSAAGPGPNAAATSHAPRTAVIADARSCVAPPYPINAYRNGQAGTVLLALLVASDGRVVESKVQKSSGSSELDKAARNALSLCKFKPAEGQTEPSWANLSYVWSID
jgi:TonB family protein